ncbi:MAG: hypothetical protein AVO33_09055 [delta proteobacterium ML8_F1]|nr:MAG: hypothetical protein AVO33_09055 [delta proteobacterium ML8_F1]
MGVKKGGFEMKGMAVWGLVLILYGILVVVIAQKKPPRIWQMKKIKFFVRVLGEKGTVIFFDVFGALAMLLGVWLLVD